MYYWVYKQICEGVKIKLGVTLITISSRRRFNEADQSMMMVGFQGFQLCHSGIFLDQLILLVHHTNLAELLEEIFRVS